MCFWSNKKSLLAKIATLEKDVEYYKQQYYASLRTIQEDKDKHEKELLNLHVAETQEANFELNFTEMQVVSIERVMHNNRSVTVIGYLSNRKVGEGIGEWYFHCSLEQHQKLAAEFVQYKRRLR